MKATKGAHGLAHLREFIPRRSEAQKQGLKSPRYFLRCKLALPYGNHAPAQVFQRRLGPPVSCDVPADLGFPESGSSFRQECPLTTGVAVPKTAIDENRRTAFRDDNVRFAGKGRRMETKMKTIPAKKRPYHFFGLRMHASNAGHYSASLRLGKHIRHCHSNFTANKVETGCALLAVTGYGCSLTLYVLWN